MCLGSRQQVHQSKCLWLKIELELGTEKKYVTWVVLNGVFFSTKIKSQSDSITKSQRE